MSGTEKGHKLKTKDFNNVPYWFINCDLFTIPM